MSIKADVRIQSPQFDSLTKKVFIASGKAATDESIEYLKDKEIWAAGVYTWFKLAQKGIFVSGCAEGFGFEFLKTMLTSSPCNKAFSTEPWTILTHVIAHQFEMPTHEHMIGTYHIEFKVNTSLIEKLKMSQMIYWASGSQFDALHSYCDQRAHHACGPGKTARYLKAYGKNPIIFPSHKDFLQWTQSHLIKYDYEKTLGFEI
jgi:hypothetical protein